MSKQNDRKYQNYSYNNRFNSQFYTNSSNPYLSNAVPFQPMPLHNPYLASHQLSSNYGVLHNGQESVYNSQGHLAHSHYAPVSSIHQSDSFSLNNLPNHLIKSMNGPLNNFESQNIDSVKISLEDASSKRYENSVLHATAQEFVPRGNNDDRNMPQRNVTTNQENYTNRSSSFVTTDCTYTEPFIKTNDGTRPKDYFRKRGTFNRKNRTHNFSRGEWKDKENLDDTKERNIETLNLENPVIDSNCNNFKDQENQAQSLGNNDMPDTFPQQFKSKPPPPHSNQANPRNKRNQERKYQVETHDPSTNYGNGSQTSNGRRNNYQKRQAYNPKKSEWRRSYDQPNNYNNNNFHYNYKDDWRNQSNSYNFSHYNKRNAKKNYDLHNVNPAINDSKFKQSRQRRSDLWQNKHNYDQETRSPSNWNHPMGNISLISDDKPPGREEDYDQKMLGPSITNEAKSGLPEKGKENLNKSLLLGDGNEKLQRENLVDSLTKGLYECMVCCDRIKQQHAIWSCNKCFNCYHLGCIKKWAGASQGEPGWRCPACQNSNSKIPSGYFCFCKKLRKPEWNRRETPHSCGEVCGKKRDNEWCTHKCTLLCHPGPCPDCSAFIKRSCQCGKTSKEVRCSQTEPYICEEVCNRTLECGVHTCEKFCHPGPCGDCTVILDKVCFCGKEKRKETCTASTTGSLSFSCNDICKRTLSCGHHSCNEICHEGLCQPCSRGVDKVTTCPCGKMSLKQYFEENEDKRRTTCEDSIPTCQKSCGKVLKCGTPGNFHACKVKCHEGECPPCGDNTEVKCRCGFMNKKIPCVELLSKADEVLCEKQCKKLRQCGRHKCGMKCCIDIDHLCTRVCGRTLKCRQHKCQETCHRGNCPRCWETSFEELSCHCGASVLYPPIPCGTEPPPCDLPCRREQPCSHLVSHSCHADPKCPPCTTLIPKPCFGNHTIMKSTPCYVSAMSCGEQCAKKLPCGVHFCQKVCHDGQCIQGSFCGQKCVEIRTTCDHPCGNLCHSGPCPNNACKEMVTVTCLCGNRKVEMVCSDNEREYKSMATSKLASELHSLNSGGSVNISQLYSKSNRADKLKRLECNDDCALIARNRQLALALQISNPDAKESLSESGGGLNLYSDSVKEEARKDISFAQMVHTALNELVMKAKQSKQKSRSHSFAPMNRDKRRFIHEYSKYFGCQSHSYDEEPKKNVVVTASKNMCRLPPISVVSVIQKEQGQRRAPGQVINRKSQLNEETGTQMRRLEKNGSFEKKDKETPTKDVAVIDYFDFS